MDILSEDLKEHRVCAHIVAKMLSEEQREEWEFRSGELIVMVDRDPDLLNTLIAGDESWCSVRSPT